MALECLLDGTGEAVEPEALYTKLDFPPAPAERPYVFLNMAATADGKVVIGEIGGTAKGVGGPTDQQLFRRLQRACDGALIGSSTLRASNVIYPPEIPRFVVTRSGEVPLSNRFFTDAPERAYVLAPEDLPEEARVRLATATNLIQAGRGGVDLAAALRRLRQEKSITRLLCEGGPTLNDALLRAGLVDELFLTLAPKLKGGAHLPTVVDGQGFPPGQFLPLTLLSLYHDGDELYLRYRIGPLSTLASSTS
jgi:riboflavin-specific deaminase-like protein